MYVLALLKVIESNNEKSGIYFYFILFNGSTQVESPICRARSQICTQYRLGVRFVRACHLALTGQTRQTVDTHITNGALILRIFFFKQYDSYW